MVIRPIIKFTPELLITTPRRSAVSPSSDGKYGLFTVSTYSLTSHSETNEIKILNLETEQVTLFSDDPSNVSPQWLVKNLLMWFKIVDGKTQIWIGNAIGAKNAYCAGKIDATIQLVRTKELADSSIALAFSAPVSDDGSIFNATKAPKPLTTAREYDTIYVRFWDDYYPRERDTLWYTTLKKDGSGIYALGSLVDALDGTDIQLPSGPSDSAALAGDLSISQHGIFMTTRDPAVDPAKHLTHAVWYISISSYDLPPKNITQIRVPGFDGMVSSPVLSDDGQRAAFLMTKSQAIGPDYNRIFVVNSIIDTSKRALVQILPVRDEKKLDGWELSPHAVIWSNDGTELYTLAEDRARTKLWKISVVDIAPSCGVDITSVSPVATALSGDDSSVSAVYPSSNNKLDKRLFVNETSFVDNGSFYIVDSKALKQTRFTSMAPNHLGLFPSQVSEFYSKGAGDYQVHSWLLKPSHFDEKKKYPLAFLIHGGPAGTWSNAWSTRWNPAVWAEQGYVVVGTNFTGSTSFGYKFAADIQGEWGGRCYQDLVKSFEYVEKNLPYVDTDRAIAAGGSFGGYMANWIAGQPLAKRFKTIICHDGIFSMRGFFGSDVPVSLDEDIGQHLWDNSELWDKYDPSRFTHNWSTPMLFIHSDRDYRCPITEGLAPYHICQMRGIPSRFLNFPDETHFVLRRENSLQWYKTVLGWANKYTGVKDGVVLQPPLTEPKKKSLAVRK
ncbi:dipeptidyl aminopeptidase [Xylariales sp. PMI_506]|nr:dipeptidyl aminopeptidase [Xylariales sp. PMI_506]